MYFLFMLVEELISSLGKNTQFAGGIHPVQLGMLMSRTAISDGAPSVKRNRSCPSNASATIETSPAPAMIQR